MHVLCCLWSLGFEEMESDPVCLCDSGAQIIRYRVEKVVYSPDNTDSGFWLRS